MTKVFKTRDAKLFEALQSLKHREKVTLDTNLNSVQRALKRLNASEEVLQAKISLERKKPLKMRFQKLL